VNPLNKSTSGIGANNYIKPDSKASGKRAGKASKDISAKNASKLPEDKVDVGGSEEEDEHIRYRDSSNDGASVGANVADHLQDSPMLEKLNAVIASALVVSGLKLIKSGIKEKSRDKILRGSKQTFWGAYHGLHAFETVFKVALALTPGLRAIGGFINADIGFTALYKDYKDEKKFKTDKAIFHAGAAAWGLRHLALGLEGLAKNKWAAGLAKGSGVMKEILSKAPILGVAGAVLGVSGGIIDATLGVRSLVKGIKTNNREKKIIGTLDIGIGVAMGVSCALTGIPGIVAVGLGTAGIVYRTWRTDKKSIKKYYKESKEYFKKIGRKIKGGVIGIKDKMTGVITGRKPKKEKKPPQK